MKVSHRVPTQQYGYIEAEQDIDDALPVDTAQEKIRWMHDFLVKTMAERPVNELPKKDFDQFIDTYLQGGNNHIEVYEKMSPAQKDIVQTIKRSLARINYKETKLHKIEE